jgi:hypothetical protein
VAVAWRPLGARHRFVTVPPGGTTSLRFDASALDGAGRTVATASGSSNRDAAGAFPDAVAALVATGACALADGGAPDGALDGAVPSLWRVLTSGTSSQLNGLWVSASGTEVYAVGRGGTILYSGKGSAGPFATQTSNTTNELYAVWGGDELDVFAGGGTGTFLYTGDRGTTWNVEMPPPALTGNRVRAVRGLSATDVWLCGQGGIVDRLTSLAPLNWTSWNASVTTTTGELRGFAEYSPLSAMVVGDAGAIIHYDGTKWNPKNSPTGGQLNGIVNFGDNSLFIVGDGGVIMHSTSPMGGFSLRTSNTNSNLEAVWGSSTRDVYAVGADGTILHNVDGDGTTWVAEPLPPQLQTTHLYAVYGSGPGDVYVAGEGGVIVHKP